MQFQVVVFVAILNGILGLISISLQHETCSSPFPLSEKLNFVSLGQETMELWWLEHGWSLISNIMSIFGFVHCVIIFLQHVLFTRMPHLLPCLLWPNNTHFSCMHMMPQIGQIWKCSICPSFSFHSLPSSMSSGLLPFHFNSLKLHTTHYLIIRNATYKSQFLSLPFCPKLE